MRELLKEGGRFPCRLTFERRLKALLPETLPGIRHGPRRPGDTNNSSLAIGSIENDLGWRPKYDLAGGIADMIRTANADR